MSPAEQLAKAFAAELERLAQEERAGTPWVDADNLRECDVDGPIDLVKLAEIALDFEPEEESLPDFDCPECGGHNRHEPGCIRGATPVDTGALRRTLSIRTPK